MDEVIIILKELNFSEYLIKTYTSMLSINQASTAYEISRKSGVPLSKIYEVLESLMNKGLIYSIPGTPKKFITSEIKTSLKNLLNKQLIEINTLSKKINDLPERFEQKEENILIFKGKERMGVFENDLTNAKKYSYSFFQSIPPINHEITELINAKLKEGVDIKGIITPTENNKLGCELWNKKFPGIYKIKNAIASSRMGVIDDEIVRFTIISNKEPVMVRIKDKDMAKLFKKTFLSEWNKK